MKKEQYIPIELTYPKNYHCTNCGRSFTHRFKRGEVASQPECPFCGVTPEQLEWERQRKRII